MLTYTIASLSNKIEDKLHTSFCRLLVNSLLWYDWQWTPLQINHLVSRFEEKRTISAESIIIFTRNEFVFFFSISHNIVNLLKINPIFMSRIMILSYILPFITPEKQVFFCFSLNTHYFLWMKIKMVKHSHMDKHYNVTFWMNRLCLDEKENIQWYSRNSKFFFFNLIYPFSVDCYLKLIFLKIRNSMENIYFKLSMECLKNSKLFDSLK